MVQAVVIENGHILNTNPATGELISRVPCTSENDVPVLVRNASVALSGWSGTALSDRIAALKNGCDALGSRKNEAVDLITAEMGKVRKEAVEEVEGAVEKDELLELIRSANEDVVLGGEAGGSRSVVVRDPLGVVVVLSPWNFPADEILLLALPALAAGNTVIVKPSEVTPQTGALVVETLSSKLPPNVLQLAQGDGAIGSLLVRSPEVSMVAMTGSTAVGKSIMSDCAPHLKRLVLELGGKDPMVVFGDADLEKAAKDAVAHSLENAGQVCCSVERIYVDKGAKNEFEQLVVDAAARYRVGDGRNGGSDVGPLVSIAQRDRVSEQVAGAIKDGARVLYRSSVPPTDSESTGLGGTGSSFYPITVLGDLKQTMGIQNLETFGPVVALSSFDGSESEAVRLANDTEYGLAGCVYTTDLEKAGRVARKIRTGQVGINCYSLDHAHLACPWVGHKSSGFGYHSGMDGFRQFSVPKSLVYEK